MYKISPNLYTRLAEHIYEEITSPTFYSGVIEMDDDEVAIRFVSTLIPYFNKEEYNGSTRYTLRDIVPVWWEIHTTTNEGEVNNDFDFSTLLNFIVQQ